LKFLFVFYLSGGGIDTLNRYRYLALRERGHDCHYLYYKEGPGLKNHSDATIFVTDRDEDIRGILTANRYDAVIVTTDHEAFPRFRSLGYAGKMIFEIQGYGTRNNARQGLTNAVPCITAHASALLNPWTPHINELFDVLMPNVPRFNFNNPFDADAFGYVQLPRQERPIVAWIGRAEHNKNWREFLSIMHYLVRERPDTRIWMYEDPTFTLPANRIDMFETIEQLGLSSRVTIYHNVSHAEMAQHYSMIGDSGGFMLSTSIEEGAPYTFLEAMNCRCPVVSSEKDGVYSAITHNQTGKMYPLGHVTAGVNESLDMMNNRMMRDYIIENAQRHVRTNFSLQAYANHFVSMVESL